MSDVNIAISFTAIKNGETLSVQASGSLNMTGTDLYLGTATIPTTWTALTFPPITGTPSFWLAKNLDSTNYVQFATANDGTHVFGRLAAGNPQPLFPEPGTTIYAKANTASVSISLRATEA